MIIINILAIIFYDSSPLHAPALLLFTIQSSPLKHLAPRTRRKRRKPFPLMRLLHNLRTPRGRGCTLTSLHHSFAASALQLAHDFAQLQSFHPPTAKSLYTLPLGVPAPSLAPFLADSHTYPCHTAPHPIKMELHKLFGHGRRSEHNS